LGATSQPERPDATRPWRPLLEGDAAARARRAIAAIADELAPWTGDDPSLSAGHAGLALLHGYRCLDGDNASEARAVDALAGALEQVAVQPAPWLFFGFGGIVWATQHLRTIVGDVDGLDDLDAMIRQVLAAPAWSHPHELMLGSLGLGVVALERAALGEAALDRVLDHLEAGCERDATGVTWRAHDRSPDGAADAPDGFFDLGIAHGHAGAIAFLAEVCARGGAPRDRAAPLLRDAVAWLRAREQPDAPQRFPLALGIDVPAEARPAGWCRGDLAIAVALVRAGQALGDDAWREAGRALARRTAAWPLADLERHAAVPLAFCHGVIGRAHLLARLGQALDDDTLLDAARTWYDVALARAERVEARRALPPGLQLGAAGLALGLLAACSTVEPAWDRAFLVALPPAPDVRDR